MTFGGAVGASITNPTGGTSLLAWNWKDTRHRGAMNQRRVNIYDVSMSILHISDFQGFFQYTTSVD